MRNRIIRHTYNRCHHPAVERRETICCFFPAFDFIAAWRYDRRTFAISSNARGSAGA